MALSLPSKHSSGPTVGLDDYLDLVFTVCLVPVGPFTFTHLHCVQYIAYIRPKEVIGASTTDYLDRYSK